MAEVARGTTNDRPFVRTIYTIAARRFTGELTLDARGDIYKLAWHRGLVAGAAAPGVNGSLAARATAVFGVADASFVLEDVTTLKDDENDTPIDPRWLIFHGLLEHYDADRIQQETAILRTAAFRVGPNAVSQLEAYGFGDEDQPLVKRLLSQSWRLDDLLAEVPDIDPMRARKVVYALLATDALDVGDAAAAAAVPVTIKATGTPPPQRAPRRAAARAAPNKGDIAEAAGMRMMVQRKVQELQAGADHFVILGLERSATGAQVRAAYFELAKQLHPDRVRQLDLGKLTGPAGQVFARVNEAWGVLGDDARRAAYLSELAGGGADAGADEAKMLALLAAEEKFRLGEMAMRRSHFSQALEDFDKAVELNPAEGEHHAMAAWVRWMDARDKDAVAARVKRQFRKAIELSPLNPSVFYYRGKLAKDLGDDEAALYCFEKTLSLDAKHEPAFREKNAAVERLAKSSAGNK